MCSCIISPFDCARYMQFIVLMSDTQVAYSCRTMLMLQADGRQLLVLTPCVCYCAGEYIAGEQLMDWLRSLIALYRHAAIEPVLLLVRLASQVRDSLRRLPRLIPPPTMQCSREAGDRLRRHRHRRPDLVSVIVAFHLRTYLRPAAMSQLSQTHTAHAVGVFMVHVLASLTT